jgi:acyl dehydratase
VASVETMKTLTGQELGVSDWVTVTQPMIDQFAQLTGDNQFIHIDVAMAEKTPFGGTIAHGLLMLSMFPAMYRSSRAPECDGARMVVNAGGNRYRFVSPVHCGKRVRGRFSQADFSEVAPGRYQQTLDFRVEIEGQEKPAAVAELVVQIFV